MDTSGLDLVSRSWMRDGGTRHGLFYIAATIIGTVYGQFMVKWRIGGFGPLPDEPLVKLKFLIGVSLIVLGTVVAARG